MDWARILAYVTGTVDQELLARNEYLAAESRVMKAQLKGRPKLSDTKAQIAPAWGPVRLRDRRISGSFPPPYADDCGQRPILLPTTKAK